MSDYFMTDRERELEARRREREAVQPPATPQEPDEIADFWREVERSYDIEPRAFFEKEAKPMGYSSAVAMAVHHMWKRDKPTLRCACGKLKLPKRKPMSAPGADPLAAIRQKLELDLECYWVDDVRYLLTQWDTHQSALRALVVRGRNGLDSAGQHGDYESELIYVVEALERLLSGPQP